MKRPTPALIFSTTLIAILLMTLSISAISAKSLPPFANRPTVALPTSTPTLDPQPAAPSPDSSLAAVPPPAESSAPAAPAAAEQPPAQAASAPVSGGPATAGSVPRIDPVFIVPTKPAYINNLKQFISVVKDGQPDHLVGVMVPGLFALDVVQQPAGDPNWVSDLENQMTEFRSATARGTIGMLAHNTRAGRDFVKIKTGDLVILVYGDGSVKRFKISSVARYQALDSDNPTSDLVDLSSNQRFTAGDVFNLFYTGQYPVVLQTCIEKNGDSQWGRLFLAATPA